jgi:hypothetical protein
MDLQTKTHRLFDIYPDIAREYAQRLHKKKEDIPYTQKFYSSSKAEAVDNERAIVSYISTADIDRDGEVLLPKGMSTKHYEESGKPVFWGHKYDEPKDVIGQCQWLKIGNDAKAVVAKTAFRNTEFADEVYQLYSEDLTGQGPILRGFSVGFIPLEWETGKKEGDPRRTYTKWELLEFSCVSIPCNPMAQTIIGQKGIKLCDRLKHDLGIDVENSADTKSEAEPVSVIESGASPDTNGDTNVETKILDAEGNPSIPDIVNALYRALNPTQEVPSEVGDAPKPWYSVQEVFPVDFPSGHCIYVEYLSGREVQPSYRQDYEYADGKATMTGERTEVVVSYTEKTNPGSETKDAPISAPADPAPVTEKGTDVPKADTVAPTPDLAAMLQAISTRLDGIEARLNPRAEPPKPGSDPAVGPGEDVIILDPEPDILAGIESAPKSIAVVASKSDEITAENVVAIINKLDIRAVIQDAVALALDKARGRVR